MLFSLALVLNTNFSSATSVNQTNVSSSINSTTNTGIVNNSSNLTKSNSTKNVVNTPIKIPTQPILINGLTAAQLENGFSRVQAFYNKNGRLPNYVTYGTRHIVIATFLKNLATQGLKIKTVNRPVYITSDNINGVSTDTDRMNSIVKGLEKLGLYAVNWGLGPNTHDQILENANIPKDALVVDIYGGVDAGLIKEMGSAWYKSLKGEKSVYSIFWPPSECITDLAWLPRAHDDDYDPTSFNGLAHPAEYLLDNGYQYLYSGNLNTVITNIYKEAT